MAAATLVPLAWPTVARAQALNTASSKASARSAYAEGVKLMEDKKYAEALQRFEAAQKLFDAPTHLLRIAQCQAATGKLVEAAETYEVLIRKNLGPTPPKAFVEAQQKADADLKELRARIPTLRITVKPEPQTLRGLEVSVNGAAMPNELLSIARPIDPGTYRLTATASGYRLPAPVDLVIAERESKAQELALVPGKAPAAMVAPMPPAYEPSAQQPQAGAESGAEAQPAGRPGEAAPSTSNRASPWGLLLGGSLGAAVPGGALVGGAAPGSKFEDVATTGVSVGLDARLRAKMFMVGLMFDYAKLGPPGLEKVGAKGDISVEEASATFIGATIGLVTSIDRLSFFGELGLGHRALSLDYTSPRSSGKQMVSGLEGGVGAGLSIPVGPIRLVPKATLFGGSFSNASCKSATLDVTLDCSSGAIPETATHSFFFVGLNAFYHIDLGSKSGS